MGQAFERERKKVAEMEDKMEAQDAAHREDIMRST